MKYGRRGFTLIEILVALALIAMAAGLAFVNLHRPVAKANSRVVADQVGEFLRRARNRAQKEARPVAVVLPNKGGSASVCQSVAELDGPVNPIITRVKDFSGEHPETVLFIGTYDASGVWSIDPPQPGNSGYYAQGLGSLPALAPINDWVGGNANNLLVFLPDGTVLGNDLPHLNGDYKIVVSQGAVTGGGAAQGNGIMDVSPTLHGLTAASDPYTVSVSALGVVTVTKGVDQATSVALSEKPLALGSPAPALLPDAKTTVNPQILELSVRPSAGFMKGAYGLDQILHPSRQLSLTVSAKQSNDEELFCEFFMSSGSGQFSVSGVQKMYYQPYFPPFLEAGWRSTVQWSPPPGAVAGQAFTVDAVVTSSRGGSATTEGNTSLRKVIYTYDKGRIYFSGLSAVTDLEEIYSVRADGTDLRKVTYQDTPDIVQRFPAGARDGHKLLYTQIDTLTTRSSIYAQTGRGGLTTRITDKGIFPSLSDDSTVMVYQWTQGLVPGSPQRPYTASPDLPAWPPVVLPVFDPSDPKLPATTGLMRPSVSPPIPFGVGPTPSAYVPDQGNRRARLPRRIAFESNLGLSNPNHRAIYTAHFYDPGKSIPVTNLVRQTQGTALTGFKGGDGRPIWHPDGTKILFESNRSGTSRAYVVPFNDDPDAEVSESHDGAICLTPGVGNVKDPFYNPSGTAIVFSSDYHSEGNWDLYLLHLKAPDYLVPAGEPVKMGLGNYSLFQKTFKDIGGAVWTL